MAERNTAQKSAIYDVLYRAPSPLGVADILAAARRTVPTLSQATVYRVLKSLLANNHVTAIRLPDQPPRYEITDRSHHHFFRCRRCERMYQVRGCDDLIDRLVPRGFTLQEHDLYLAGLCAGCNHPG